VVAGVGCWSSICWLLVADGFLFLSSSSVVLSDGCWFWNAFNLLSSCWSWNAFNSAVLILFIFLVPWTVIGLTRIMTFLHTSVIGLGTPTLLLSLYSLMIFIFDVLFDGCWPWNAFNPAVHFVGLGTPSILLSDSFSWSLGLSSA